jgi:nitrous oxidase accessory protein
VVRSSGRGTTVLVEPSAAGTTLAGFTVDGSGARYDQLDAAVAVHANGTTVDGLAVVHAVFGILVERARDVTVRGNEIDGDGGSALGLRGDPIRLWETTGSLVEKNRVRAGRDVVVWYSPRNRIAGNVVAGGRYGTHLMYSSDCVVEDNRYLDDVVGVFIMYSHRVTLARNLIQDASGSAGMGVGLKDSGDVTVRANAFVHDTSGLYVDNSPSQLGERVVVEGNLFRLCDAAVTFLGGGERNRFAANVFAGNEANVRSDGDNAVAGASFDGNFFDDYAGYDLDGDGVGDVPYELRALSAELVSHYPDLRFFRGQPALDLVDAAGRLFPLFPPALVLADAHPRVDPIVAPEVPRAN